MNKLVVGSDKEPLLQNLPPHFLFIDDGELIDQLDLPSRRHVTVLDFEKHSFNPLRGMDYRKAREFWDVLKAVFPEGESTLTKSYAEYQILTALAAKPRKLETLIKDTKDTQYAFQMIAKLLMSPVLKNVLTRPTNFSFKDTIIARLDRSKLTDFECFVLANLLISQFQRAVVVPDFGFYQCPFHTALLRQNRLIAGINSFDEVPRFKSRLLLIKDKTGVRCTPDDAEVLVGYKGLSPYSVGFREEVERLIGA